MHKFRKIKKPHEKTDLRKNYKATEQKERSLAVNRQEINKLKATNK